MEKNGIPIILLIILIFLFSSPIITSGLPGQTTIIFLNEPSEGYRLGDTVEVLLTAESNEYDGKEIKEFELLAYYENKLPSNIEYQSYKNAVKESNQLYKAQFSFTLTKKENAILTIEGRAWDTESLPGGTGTTTIYVSQKSYSDDNSDSINDNIKDDSTLDTHQNYDSILFLLVLIIIILGVIIVLLIYRKK